MLNILYLLVGVALLTAGGEGFIRGALGLAKKWGLSALFCGLVIVGFGTSMPELFVSVNAALNNQPDIAIGNVIGSNIANVLLILGLCAMIMPLTVAPISLRRDALMVIAASVLCIALSSKGVISFAEGLLLLGALAAYLTWTYLSEKGQSAPAAELHAAEGQEIENVPQSMFWSVVQLVVGLGLLIAGSQILLKGAVGIAHGLGVSEAVIGLTLVAFGTSLPELTISIIAALRKHADVAVGNILGSNIFNLLGILGVSSLIKPIQVTGRVAEFDQWVMLAVALVLLLFLYTGRRLSRTEGGILFLAYVVYIGVSYVAFTS
ncbi:inner membrane protein [Paraglaciecola mesophila KMM 241]|uniref:Inner membrane protein n=1 Tax=Paraglaciecola mesophila KMM 241 TaxID=1128912 RepID=K6ZPV2_9ALTE|nr:calcium/sodium antiporter [Paraglaciecola mesophila]GAC25355.1 inner membrane protein [Paraglaciecola mesophila KMM 241]|tara:strand:+ start:4411 stop:5373 length:963 start_codon:yes stop_codon:yes gene_type:complete